MERLADGFFSGKGGSVNGGDRCTLHVHTDLDTLKHDGQGAEDGEPLNKSARSAFQSEKLQIVRAVASDSSQSYGRVASRARCGFSGETLSGRAFAGPPPCLGSLIWNDQTTLTQAKPEPPANAPSRPRRLVQRLPFLAEGGNVSAETSRRLACDCAVVPWQESEDGQTLNVGRKTRSIPPAIRRALQKRDQGCRFPGCTAHKHVDAHHVKHWADGGETKLDNLVTLCRHHHRAVHEGGFTVKMTPNSQPEFQDRNGKPIPEAPQMRYRGNVFALINTNRRQGIRVSAETCIPEWGGEAMDSDMVIAKLVELEPPT